MRVIKRGMERRIGGNRDSEVGWMLCAWTNDKTPNKGKDWSCGNIKLARLCAIRAQRPCHRSVFGWSPVFRIASFAMVGWLVFHPQSLLEQYLGIWCDTSENSKQACAISGITWHLCMKYVRQWGMWAITLTFWFQVVRPLIFLSPKSDEIEGALASFALPISYRENRFVNEMNANQRIDVSLSQIQLVEPNCWHVDIYKPSRANDGTFICIDCSCRKHFTLVVDIDAVRDRQKQNRGTRVCRCITISWKRETTWAHRDQ